MAVLSNKPVIPRVPSLKLWDWVRSSQIYGGNSFATKKPDPEGARKLLEENGVRPEEAGSSATRTSTLKLDRTPVCGP
jgi:phosphoglycolate phosphatase